MSLVTLKEKTEQLIEKANRNGVILSDFSGSYKQPKKADMRGLIVTNAAVTYNRNLFAYMFANINANGNGGYYVLLEEVYLPENINCLYPSMFAYCPNLTTLHGDFSNVETIHGNAFLGCSKLPTIPYCPKLQTIGTNAFGYCKALTEVTLPSTITSIHSGAFTGCTNLLDIYVPWAEGAIANAPWGATNATIHYNSEV